MPYLFKPTEAQTTLFLEKEKTLEYSYKEVGSTQKETLVAGFDNDFNTLELGHGPAVWEAAKEAIRQWKMFPGGWACIWPENTPIQQGEHVAMLAKVMGLWWLNSCRIVYIVDNQDQFGFAYGTLPGHAECGEELFMVEKTADGTVRYVLKAFSRPRLWIARLGYPIARAQQRKFVRYSKASMFNFVVEQTRKAQ
jgi:uncharacterized protein (UPF0548 family)